MRSWPLVAWLRGHPRLADGMLAGILFVIGLIGLEAAYEQGVAGAARSLDPVGLALLVVGTLPLTFRRERATLVLVLTSIGSLGLQFADYGDNAAQLAPMVAIYSVAAHCPRRERVAAGITVLVVTTIILAAAVVVGEEELTLDVLLSNYVVVATAYILGDNLQTRRAYLAQLEEKAGRLERERDSETRQALAVERTRIARELHDVVAHSVSVMVVQAGAARRTLERDPTKAAEALISVESTGRQALTEMRRLLGVLRSERDGPDLEPQPSVESIEVLAGQCRDAGLPVEVRIQGQPRPLPAAVGLSAFRIVQEALTNTRKHAGPATACVTLRFDDGQLDIEVADDGRGAAADITLAGTGARAGIMGMRERVTMLGGDLRAGPRPGGGYAVRARLPLEPSTPQVPA